MAAVQVNQARSIGVSQKANLFANGASYNAIRFDHCLLSREAAAGEARFLPSSAPLVLVIASRLHRLR
jgi:hypothetical protein